MISNDRTGEVAAPRAITGWLVRALAGTLFIGLIMFAAAGRLDWLNGWLYVSWYLVVSLVSVLITDPALLAERSRPVRTRGQKGWDVVLLGLYGTLTPLVIPLVAALNFRYGWPPVVSAWLQVAGCLIYALGWGIHLWAMAANRYFALAVRIQHDRGQTVMTGGPYRFVRHPGYTGGILLTLAAALVLGSVWALIPGALGALVLVIRTILEDRTLQRELDGYQAYAQRVHYRLVPEVW
jgi:protein-S-isoprenylcysteine O-methyltransferase Ste14